MRAIEASADAAAKQLDELADSAKLQTQQLLRLRLEPIDLVELARTKVAVFQAATEHHTPSVVAPAPVIGVWDRARLHRVVDNLLSNAVKFSPNGGQITGRVDRASDPDGEWSTLTVSDEGIGIPAIDLPHIFDQFHRGANVRRTFEGQGLGLAAVHQIVTRHGGTVTATSKEGQGTTLTIRLPLARPRDHS